MLCVVEEFREKIVGDEAFASRRHFLLFDHRMAAFDNFEIARLSPGFCSSSNCGRQ